MPTERIAMRRVREMLRLKLEENRKRSFCAGRSGLTAAFIQAARALAGRAAFQAQGMSSSIRLFGWPLTIRVRTSVR